MNLVYCFSKIAKKPINGKHSLSVDSSIGFLELSPVNADSVFTSKQGEPHAAEHSVSAKEGLSLTRGEPHTMHRFWVSLRSAESITALLSLDSDMAFSLLFPKNKDFCSILAIFEESIVIQAGTEL